MGLAELKEKKQISEPIKVLIADDDTPTRILLRHAVKNWGYEVVEAADGEEAWQLLQQPNVPKLLIVDWLMPKLDGIDLCRRIKNEMKDCPYIILLTQLSGTTNIVKGLEAGANEFLSKPFNMAELQSRLSIGARIIRYQSSLTDKVKMLTTYANAVDEMTGYANSAAEIIDEIVTLSPDQLVERSHKLQAEIKKIRLSLEKLQEEKDKDDGVL
jgi:DNA-binding response OmpR family regulator